MREKHFDLEFEIRQKLKFVAITNELVSTEQITFEFQPSNDVLDRVVTKTVINAVRSTYTLTFKIRNTIAGAGQRIPVLRISSFFSKTSPGQADIVLPDFDTMEFVTNGGNEVNLYFDSDELFIDEQSEVYMDQNAELTFSFDLYNKGISPRFYMPKPFLPVSFGKNIAQWDANGFDVIKVISGFDCNDFALPPGFYATDELGITDVPTATYLSYVETT